MKQTAPANERLPKAEIGGAMLRSSSCLGSEASPSQSGTARSAAGYGRTTCACPEATAPPLACAPARESPSPDRTPHAQRLPSRRPQDTQEGGHRPSDRRGQRHVKRGDPDSSRDSRKMPFGVGASQALRRPRAERHRSCESSPNPSPSGPDGWTLACPTGSNEAKELHTLDKRCRFVSHDL